MIQSNKVTILIPNYNGVDLLKKNVLVFLDSARNGDEILFMDDASTDDSVSWLLNYFGKMESKNVSIDGLLLAYPKLKNQKDYLGLEYWTNIFIHEEKKITISILKNKKNLRFGATVNIGFYFAKNDYIFLINNDVLPQTNAIQPLLELFSDTFLFAVGCLEYEKDSKGEKSGKNELYFSKGLFWHRKAPNMDFGETAWASGGSALFDKQKWMILEGFDPDFYPAYWEDTDISFRARKKGWKVLFEPKSVVYHVHESTNNSVFGQRKIRQMSWRSAQVFTWKHATFQQRIAYLIWFIYWKFSYWRWNNNQK